MKIDSTLIWPKHTKHWICAGCGHHYFIRYYGDPIANMLVGMNETFIVEIHLKNCFGQRNA